MEPPMIRTTCLFTPPPRPPTNRHTASLQHLVFLPSPPRCHSFTVARKNTWRVQRLYSRNLSCSLRKILASMGWGIFRTALMHMAPPCNACISLAHHVVFEGRSIHMTYPCF